MNASQPRSARCGSPRLRLLAAATLLSLASLAQAQNPHIIRVGAPNDPACDYSDLFEALSEAPRDVPVQVRVAQIDTAYQPGYENLGPLLVIDRDLTLSGGYANCSSTVPSSGKRSRLRNLLGGSPVLSVFSAAQPVPRTLRIERFEISGGDASGSGGGLRIAGANRVELVESHVVGNQANEYGGGIFVDGASASLHIDGGSLVAANAANAWGGGIACRDGRVSLGTATVQGNSAFAHGGGVFAHGCEIELQAGVLDVFANQVDASANPDRDVFDPVGMASGGGFYLSGSSRLFASADDSMLLVRNNSVMHRRLAATRIDRGFGGGLMLRNGAKAELGNVHIATNLARQGGAAMLRDAAQLQIDPDTGACSEDARFVGCASISGNHARGFVRDDCHREGGQGGALALRHSTRANLYRVRLESNQAQHGASPTGCDASASQNPAFGSAFDLGVDSRVVLFDSLLTGHSGIQEQDVIRVRDRSRLDLMRSTVADNSRTVPTLSTSGGSSSDGPQIRLWSSLLHQVGGPIFASGADGDVLTAYCSSVSSLAQLQLAATSVIDDVDEEDPGFEARTLGNYRLRADSPARDRCAGPFEVGQSRDLDGIERPQYGGGATATAMDRGAYERLTGVTVVDLAVQGGWQGTTALAPGGVVEAVLSVRNAAASTSSAPGLRIVLDPGLAPVEGSAVGEGWSCSPAPDGWTCSAAAGIAAGALSPALRFAARAPETPAALSGSYVALIDPLDQIDPEASNDRVDLPLSIALDADLGFAPALYPDDAWQRGRLAHERIELRNEGPQLAWQPQVELFLPAEADTPLLSLAAPANPSGWQCSGPTRAGDGRWRFACSAAQLAPGGREGFDLTYGVPRNASGSDWTVEARVASISDPDAPPRLPNLQLITRGLDPASDLEATLSGPPSVSHGQIANFQPRLSNHGDQAFEGQEFWLGAHELGTSFGNADLSLVELIPAEGYACEAVPNAAPLAKGLGTTSCLLTPALAAGASTTLAIRVRPEYPVGPHWLLHVAAHAWNAGDHGAEALWLSTVDAGPQPPAERVFGNGFE